MVDLFNDTIDVFWEGSEYVSKRNLDFARNKNKDISVPQYYDSHIVQMNARMVILKKKEGHIVYKLSPTMGYYNVIRYCSHGVDISKELTRRGVTLRGAEVSGVKDNFGSEFIYNTNNFIEAKGAKYSRVRNVLNKYQDSISIDYVFNDDIVKVAEDWSKKSQSKHQLKLLKLVYEMKDNLSISTIYIGGEAIGYSVVEKINEYCGVIVQRLINPNIISKYKEPNILIHYGDCFRHPDMLLNIGAGRSKNISVAKQKLVPEVMLPIYRNVSETIVSKDEYYHIKQSIK